LSDGQAVGLIGAISGAVAAENIRHLKRGTHAGNQFAGVTIRLRRSSGLVVSAISVVAT